MRDELVSIRAVDVIFVDDYTAARSMEGGLKKFSRPCHCCRGLKDFAAMQA